MGQLRISMWCDWPEEFRWRRAPRIERVGLLVGTLEFMPAGAPHHYYVNNSPTEGDFNIVAVHLVENSHEFPTDEFRVSAAEVRRVSRTLSSGQIIGVAHTHIPGTSPWPSGEDVVGLPAGWIGAVISPSTRRTSWYVGRQ